MYFTSSKTVILLIAVLAAAGASAPASASQTPTQPSPGVPGEGGKGGLVDLLTRPLAAAVFVLTDGPATQPTAMERRLRGWIEELSDNDQAVRERAKFNLLGLSRDDLPALKEAAEKEMPLSPDQQLALRDVVFHVYLSGDNYEAIANEGFLGLQWPFTYPDFVDIGQYVETRLPGFGAYRYLRTGDIIVGILSDPSVDCRDTLAFRSAIKAMLPGQTVRLRILRRGQLRDVSIVLDEMPAVTNLENGIHVEDWLIQRRQAAEGYWDANFVQVMGNGVASAAAN
ncbi:MAG TPA: hypothetical protein VMD30_01820 [Tepidisphaeraceae bacterium]|nr:hypothetical protein [Tepidisphaeraceae bacterium]